MTRAHPFPAAPPRTALAAVLSAILLVTLTLASASAQTLTAPVPIEPSTREGEPALETAPAEPAAEATPATAETVPTVRIETVAVAPAEPGRLRVGVAARPPFAMAGPDGAWVGIGADLWRLVAEREGYAFDWVETDDPLTALASGSVDVALPLTPSAEAEERVDFSHAFYTATLGAAGVRSVDLWATASSFLSWRFARIVIGLSVILLVVGAIMWLIERKANPEQFGTTDDDVEGEAGLGRRTLRGLGSGFWWSGVTMTTIGYGDKAPITVPGRAVAMMWMLISLALTSALTASIVAATDLSGAGKIAIPGDLEGKRVGVVKDSTAASYLEAENVSFTPYDDLEVALRDAQSDALDAVVAPLPILEHLVAERELDVTVSPSRAEPALMTFGLAPNGALREPVNAAVLDLTTGSGWVDLVERYAPQN